MLPLPRPPPAYYGQAVNTASNDALHICLEFRAFVVAGDTLGGAVLDLAIAYRHIRFMDAAYARAALVNIVLYAVVVPAHRPVGQSHLFCHIAPL